MGGCRAGVCALMRDLWRGVISRSMPPPPGARIRVSPLHFSGMPRSPQLCLCGRGVMGVQGFASSSGMRKKSLSELSFLYKVLYFLYEKTSRRVRDGGVVSAGDRDETDCGLTGMTTAGFV